MRRTTTIAQAVLWVQVTLAALISFVLLVVLPWIEHPAVVPLTVATAVVFVLPLLFDQRAGRLDLAEPFTLAVWTVAFWHFVVGAAAYAVGLHDEIFYLDRLEGDGTIVVTQILILIGLSAVGLCARSRPVARVANRIGPLIPRGPTASKDLQVVTWTLLAVGVGASVLGRASGVFGYATTSTGTAGVAVPFAAMMAAASPITCVEACRSGASTRAVRLMAAAIGLGAAIQSVMAGNRGTVVLYVVTSVIALSRGGRRFDLRRVVAWSMVCVAIGGAAMLYGSAYRDASREIDGSASNDLVGNATDALSDLWDRGPGVASYGSDRVVERLDSLLSASVVIQQYEELRSVEEQADLTGEIASAAVGAFVPRAIWSDKPSVDPLVLAEVYFGFGNAYATTPMTTLTRNFGPWSIPIGMGLVGLVLGVAHRALADSRSWTGLRAVVYVVLATRAVNYEGSYASFFPDATRIVGMFALTCAVAWLVARAIGGGQGWGPSSSAAPAGATDRTISAAVLVIALVSLATISQIVAQFA